MFLLVIQVIYEPIKTIKSDQFSYTLKSLKKY
jgi:hypothetical protein